MKTLVELFDECQLENVMAGLKLNPGKIIFVGYKKIMTEGRKSSVENLLRNRCHNIRFEYETVGRHDFDSIYNKLIDIAENNDDCVFDITGGKELILTATGAVAADRKIPVIQFDVKTGKAIPVMNCGDMGNLPAVSLTFDENVMLNGGAIVEKENDDFEWELTADFKSDLEKIWAICRRDCAQWNRNIGAMASVEPEGKSFGNFRVILSKERFSGDNAILKELLENGLIKDYEEDSASIFFCYKNESVYRTLSKAGSILELYTYMLLDEITSEEESYYDDILTGVVVDWDGIVYKSFRYPADTQNELDVVVMRDAVPLFVSCKNGEVHKAALYELDTVAKKFGGKYAKKFLVSTYVAMNEKAKSHIKGRARDMKIDLICDVDKLSREEYKEVLKNRIR